MDNFRSGKDPKQRYEELDLLESLNERSRYAAACRELAFILRNSYSKTPKNLQSLIFQDTVSAFRLLPVISTQAAVASANVLLQSAEFALPKQKKVLAVAEFKHAVVTSKRQSKSQQEQDDPGVSEFPEDVLLHVFSYLDLQSLASAGMVSRSWKSATNDGLLWQSLYNKFFGFSKTCIGVQIDTYWRDEFKSMYRRLLSKKVALYRGYCTKCDSIVWLNDSRCYSTHPGENCKNPKIIPISVDQIASYVLYDTSPHCPVESSSDSDSDSDELPGCKLFRYSSDMI